MKKIKTYEGFFDFLKRKDSEDDKIVLSYINRLNKVEGLSPYRIESDTANNEGFDVIGYDISFDDTPIRSTKVVSFRKYGFDQRSQKYLTEMGAVRKNDKEFYALSVNCEGEREMVYSRVSLLEELHKLCKKVYDADVNAKRLQRINKNINPAADLMNEQLNQINDKIDFKVLTKLEDERDSCVEGDDVIATYFSGGYDTYEFKVQKIYNSAFMSPQTTFDFGYADYKNQITYRLEDAYHVVKKETYNDFVDPDKALR